MKTLIANKKYEIGDARLVAEYNKTADISEDDSYREELYLKNSGTYLLYGRGGSKTPWNEFEGEGIKLLSVEQAIEWIRQHRYDNKHLYTDLWGEAAE